jgi:hypothetical protein
MTNKISEVLRVAQSRDLSEETRSQALVRLFLLLEKGSTGRKKENQYDELIPELAAVELNQEQREELIKRLTEILASESVERIRSTILWGYGTAGIDLAAITVPSLLRVLEFGASLKSDEIRQALLSLDRLLSTSEGENFHPGVRRTLQKANVSQVIAVLTAMGNDQPKEKKVRATICKKLRSFS